MFFTIQRENILPSKKEMNKAVKKLTKTKALPVYATKALVGRESIAPTHSRPRH
jgi:hypothetical protein